MKSVVVSLKNVSIKDYPQDAFNRLKELNEIHSTKGKLFVEGGFMYETLCEKYTIKQKEFQTLYSF